MHGLKILQRLGLDASGALAEVQQKLKLLDLMAAKVEDLKRHGEVFVVYALSDPRDGRVRYIGESSRVWLRYRDHVRNSYRQRVAKDSWIVSLLRAALAPDVIVLSADVAARSVDEYEKAWIGYARDEGWDLLNLTEGGRGCHGLVPESEAKRIRANRVPRDHAMSAAARIRLSVARTGAGNPMFGVRQSAESHAKRIATWRARCGGEITQPPSVVTAIRNRMLGHAPSVATREKQRMSRLAYFERVRAANGGRLPPASPTTIAQLWAAQAARKPVTAETRAKMRASKLAYNERIKCLA